MLTLEGLIGLLSLLIGAFSLGCMFGEKYTKK